MKTQGLIIGRFQPPTIVHTQIIQTALRYSNIQYVQIVESKSNTGSQRNPLSGEFRSKLIKQIFPDDNIQIFIYPTGSLDDIIHTIENDNPDIVFNQIFCGSDRIEKNQKQLDKYFTNHPKINLIEINREVSDLDNISQTKLREQIISDNRSLFEELQPTQLHLYYSIIRSRLLKLV